MRIEYMQSQEPCRFPIVRIGVADGGMAEGLPDISGLVSLCSLTDAQLDMSFVQLADGVVQVQADGIDLRIRCQGDLLDTSLVSAFHLLVAGVFAPGLIGVDWLDVCSLLRGGHAGTLLSVALDERSDLDSIIRHLSVTTEVEAKAIIASCCLPKAKFFASGLDVVNGLAKALEAVTGEFVLAAPVVSNDKPILSLMLITD